jgi:hypothetical protein
LHRHPSSPVHTASTASTIIPTTIASAFSATTTIAVALPTGAVEATARLTTARLTTARLTTARLTTARLTAARLAAAPQSAAKPRGPRRRVYLYNGKRRHSFASLLASKLAPAATATDEEIRRKGPRGETAGSGAGPAAE